jgi:signal peptidase I
MTTPASLALVVAVLFFAGCDRKVVTIHYETMKPTIRSGDKITVDFSAYRFGSPRRWDIVAFHPIDEHHKDDVWFMRIVGLPGEKISFSDGGQITINNMPARAPSAISSVQFHAIDSRLKVINGPVPLFFPYIIPKDSYFVVGDNANNAFDSRYWGALPRANIIGKVLGR